MVAKAIDVLDDDFYKRLQKEFTIKREKICTVLDKCGLTPYVPQGAYYVLADISKIEGSTSKEKCMRLLERTGVACVPGESFYHGCGGENLARFCFAKDDDVLDLAASKLIELFVR